MNNVFYRPAEESLSGEVRLAERERQRQRREEEVRKQIM